MTARRLTPSIRMGPWLLLELPARSTASPQRKACYKNANVQLVPAGTREGTLHAAALRGDPDLGMEAYGKAGAGCGSAGCLAADTHPLPKPAVLTAESSPSLPRGW